MIRALPLTAEAFAPFGHVARNGEGAVKSIRDGSVVLTKTDARCSHDAEAQDFAIDFYDTKPERDILTMRQAEHHPHSAQMFIALGAERYLVVVWDGEPTPDRKPQAFVARGTDMVIYNPGVWHHGIVAIDKQTLFASAMWKTHQTDTVFRALDASIDVTWS